jgi:hypothetical protein
MESSTTLQVLVGLFLLAEVANIATLYFAPGSTYGNGVGVFDGWAKSQADADLGPFVRYLVYWVAGTKLIFIALWLVILLTAGPDTQFWASVVMVPAIATFYWRLFPIARDLDRRGQVSPAGYSKVLGWMIAVMLVAFVVAIGTAL